MNYGYQLFAKKGYEDVGHTVKYHCGVLFATLHISLWNLCRTDMLRGIFTKVLIFDADTGKELFTVREDDLLTSLYQKRELNSSDWNEYVRDLTQEDWNKKTDHYLKKIEKIKIYQTRDADLIKAIDERVKEIQKTLEG